MPKYKINEKSEYLYITQKSLCFPCIREDCTHPKKNKSFRYSEDRFQLYTLVEKNGILYAVGDCGGFLEKKIKN